MSGTSPKEKESEKGERMRMRKVECVSADDLREKPNERPRSHNK
jgi:hypothetical protein